MITVNSFDQVLSDYFTGKVENNKIIGLVELFEYEQFYELDVNQFILDSKRLFEFIDFDRSKFETVFLCTIFDQPNQQSFNNAIKFFSKYEIVDISFYKLFLHKLLRTIYNLKHSDLSSLSLLSGRLWKVFPDQFLNYKYYLIKMLLYYSIEQAIWFYDNFYFSVNDKLQLVEEIIKHQEINDIKTFHIIKHINLINVRGNNYIFLRSALASGKLKTIKYLINRSPELTSADD